MGMSNYQELLQVIARQEQELQFDEFTNETALTIGLKLIERAKRENKPVAIDITRNGQQLFHYALAGTAPDNDQWIVRKNKLVNRMHHSSFYIGTKLRSEAKTLEEKYEISSLEYAAHGGAFPIIIRNVGVVGTITVSGLPQEEDHAMVVTVLQEYLHQ